MGRTARDHSAGRRGLFLRGDAINAYRGE